MDMEFCWAAIGGFAGGLVGTAAVHLFAVILLPLRNRAEHKRLLEQETFKAQWGRNPLSFFLFHGGFGRGG